MNGTWTTVNQWWEPLPPVKPVGGGGVGIGLPGGLPDLPEGTGDEGGGVRGAGLLVECPIYPAADVRALRFAF
jgi:hypothetical protein